MFCMFFSENPHETSLFRAYKENIGLYTDFCCKRREK